MGDGEFQIVCGDVVHLWTTGVQRLTPELFKEHFIDFLFAQGYKKYNPVVYIAGRIIPLYVENTVEYCNNFHNTNIQIELRGDL